MRSLRSTSLRGDTHTSGSMDGAPVLLRFEWPTGSVADLSNVDYFFVFVDGVENPVDVWLVAIEQVMKV